jgi:hypothetical protein
MKALVIFLIFTAEALAIGSEIYGARAFHLNPGSPIFIFLRMFCIMVIAGGLLIVGYMLGYKYFQNIWIVSTISITSILLIEPILNLTLFKQFPTPGALIGFVLGGIGLIIALIF